MQHGHGTRTAGPNPGAGNAPSHFTIARLEEVERDRLARLHPGSHDEDRDRELLHLAELRQFLLAILLARGELLGGNLRLGGLGAGAGGMREAARRNTCARAGSYAACRHGSSMAAEG
jgi:hypothetical protein